MTEDAGGDGGLLRAATQGDAAAVRRLLEEGADPNARDAEGRTPLMAAAKDGDLDIVSQLLDKGADPNIESGCAVPPLVEAALGGELEIVRLLLRRGADPTLRGGGYLTPLEAAAVGGHLPVVEELLGSRPELEAGAVLGGAALRRAAKAGQEDAVRLLLREGAAVNARDRMGCTPLMMAALGGHAGVVGLLLERGADVAARNDPGQTAYMFASMRGQAEIVGILERAGVPVDRQKELPEDAARRPGDRVRVLVMDRDPDLTLLVRMMLEPRGYEVREASDGIAGMEEARTFEPDIILITTLMLSPYGGIETCRKFREAPQTKHVPIIFSSSGTGGLPEQFVRSVRESGATDYLRKPFSHQDLLRMIDKHAAGLPALQGEAGGQSPERPGSRRTRRYCPRCGSPMHEGAEGVGYGYSVMVWVCPACGRKEQGSS